MKTRQPPALWATSGSFKSMRPSWKTRELVPASPSLGGWSGSAERNDEKSSRTTIVLNSSHCVELFLGLEVEFEGEARVDHLAVSLRPDERGHHKQAEVAQTHGLGPPVGEDGVRPAQILGGDWSGVVGVSTFAVFESVVACDGRQDFVERVSALAHRKGKARQHARTYVSTLKVACRFGLLWRERAERTRMEIAFPLDSTMLCKSLQASSPRPVNSYTPALKLCSARLTEARMRCAHQTPCDVSSLGRERRTAKFRRSCRITSQTEVFRSWSLSVLL
eukprot:3895327-Rhodomonas_salina.1